MDGERDGRHGTHSFERLCHARACARAEELAHTNLGMTTRKTGVAKTKHKRRLGLSQLVA